MSFMSLKLLSTVAVVIGKTKAIEARTLHPPPPMQNTAMVSM